LRPSRRWPASLRLRNIGGLIILDLIDMKSKKNRINVYKVLKDALRRDKARTNVLPISQLGLLEMTRQRVDEGFFRPCAWTARIATGAGRSSRR